MTKVGVDSYARHHGIPIEWAEKGVFKDSPSFSALALPVVNRYRSLHYAVNSNAGQVGP